VRGLSSREREVPQDIGNTYKRHLAGRNKVEKTNARGKMIQYWEKRGDDHMLDCEAYQAAVAMSLQILGIEAYAPPTDVDTEEEEHDGND